MNNLSSDRIFIGQSLKVNSTVAAPETGQPEVKESVYTVRSGDTLSRIARDNGTTVSSLLALNNLSSDRIFIGQSLKVNGTVAAPETSQPEVKESVYTVRSGDTLSRIARDNGTTV
ncbi:Membrane-bound lytic murein transglycosylase D precursor [Alkalibacterium sp. AK22]|nr:Membrane-bound lytic murein transglycosylase D precursor [Alkalibacterium sp. AK22]